MLGVLYSNHAMMKLLKKTLEKHIVKHTQGLSERGRILAVYHKKICNPYNKTPLRKKCYPSKRQTRGWKDGSGARPAHATQTYIQTKHLYT